MSKLLIHIAFIVLAAQTAVGQMLTSPIRFTPYSIAEGLPSNIVHSCMQDSRGFIWWGTAQGLVRYDGTGLTIYRHSRTDSNSMPHDAAGNCIELRNHQLVFNSSARIWMLNPYNHQQYPPPVFWSGKKIALLKLLNSNLIGVQTEHVTYFANMDLGVIDSVKTPFESGFSFIYLDRNRVLFSKEDKVFSYSLSDKKMEEWDVKKVEPLSSQLCNIEQVDTINKVVFFLHYFAGVYSMSYEPKSADYMKPYPVSGSDIGGTATLRYKNDTLLVAGETGLVLLQKSKSPVLVHASIGQNGRIYQDQDENFWITGRDGISRFNLKQLNYQYIKLPYPANLQFCNKQDGKIWMYSDNFGTLYFDTHLQRVQVIDSTIIRYCWGATPVNNLVYLHGNGYLGKNATPDHNIKMLAYNLITKKITTPSFLKRYYHNAELITMVYQAHNGDVWYSLNTGNGIVRQKAATNEFRQYRNTDTPPPFKMRYVNKAAEDKQGNVYFSVNKASDILVWKNKEEHFVEWRADSLFSQTGNHFGPLANHIIDSKQNLWLAYESTGLVQYNLITKKLKLFERDDGLPGNTFESMVADAAGNIWMATAKGLVCLVTATNKFLVFTARDGLPFTDFFASSLFYDATDSSMYFGSPGYLYRVNTSGLLANKKQSNTRLYIDKMDVNSQPYYFQDNENIRLEPVENNLQFSFATLDFDNTSPNTNFEYALVKNTNAPIWQKLNSAHLIAFNQLNPGAYTLRVRMLNEATNNYVEGRNIFRFMIATKWFNTIWFITVCFATGTFLVWLLIRQFYQRRLERQQVLLAKEKALADERTRIASDMHDDVGAGLSRILYISAEIKNNNPVVDDAINKIVALSDESVDKMNEIIWALNQGNQKLDELVYYIRSQCGEMVNNAGIVFICEPPENITAVAFGWIESRNTYLLVRRL